MQPSRSIYSPNERGAADPRLPSILEGMFKYIPSTQMLVFHEGPQTKGRLRGLQVTSAISENKVNFTIQFGSVSLCKFSELPAIAENACGRPSRPIVWGRRGGPA